jgi:YVTN family beta-propeller protein
MSVASACANMTADAEPVLHTVTIAGLASRAQAGAEAYVCTYGYDSAPGATVTPVNLDGDRADSGITTGTIPDAVAASPDGRLVLVTDEDEDQLSVINTSNGHVVATIPTGLEPDAVAVSPDGDLAVVANSGDGTVTPVDLHTMRAESAVHVGGEPDAVGIGGPGAHTALVANLAGGTVTPLNLETMRVGRPIRVGDEPDAIAVSLDGDSALVTDLGSDAVTFVDLVTLRASTSVNVGIPPTGIATDPEGTGGAAGGGSGDTGSGPVAWVSGGSSLVSVSFASRPVVGRTIPVGHLAEAVAIARGGAAAWVADADPYVTEVDLVTGRDLKSVRVGGRPSAITIPPPID